MPSIRVGFSSDFTLGNQLVGVGTTSAVRRLNVIGAIKGDFETLGVSTLSVYEGFVPEFQNISIASTIGFSTSGVGTFVQVTESETGYLSLTTEFNSVSEDIVVDEGRIFEVSIGSTATLGSLESISVQSHFSVPNGLTTARPADPVEGMVRFNDDLNTLEFWNGFEWRQFTVTGASGRGVFGGGANPASQSVIDFINISSTGNALNFGTLSVIRSQLQSCSSSTRGLFAGGYVPGTFYNVVDYVTIASEGNAIDFGDLNIAARRKTGGGCSSSTRGLFGGGYTGTPTATSFNTIDYVQIATLGNAQDFGDLSITRSFIAACSSSTRGVFAGGFSQPSPANLSWNIIEFVTIASTGNVSDFGDLTQTRHGPNGCSSNTRGVFGGGVNPANVNTMDYITISSVGNATDFGNLTQAKTYTGACSSNIRGIFGGGETPTSTNTIEYITIASTSNAQDFGDLTVGRVSLDACSDSHGGLGGF